MIAASRTGISVLGAVRASVASLLGLLVAAGAAAQATDPPLLPEPAPPPLEAPPPPPGAPPPGGPAYERYQQCFQKMIDAGATDNTFMRKCLGLEPRAAGKGEALGRQQVQVVALEGIPAVRACYEKLLQQTKALGVTPEGALDLKLDIKADGKVKSVQFQPTSLTDAALLQCVRERALAWRFPKAAHDEPLEALVSYRLAAPGRKAQVTLAKGSPRLVGAALAYTQDELAAVFRKNMGAVRRCYDELHKRQPGAAGVAAPDLVVSPQGRVSRVAFRELTVGDGAFKACLTQTLRKWRFPKPRSGERTPVQYPPWTFSPAMLQQ